MLHKLLQDEISPGHVDVDVGDVHVDSVVALWWGGGGNNNTRFKVNCLVDKYPAIQEAGTRGRRTLLIWSPVMTEELARDWSSCRTMEKVFSPLDSSTMTMAWRGTHTISTINIHLGHLLLFYSTLLYSKGT